MPAIFITFTDRPCILTNSGDYSSRKPLSWNKIRAVVAPCRIGNFLSANKDDAIIEIGYDLFIFWRARINERSRGFRIVPSLAHFTPLILV